MTQPAPIVAALRRRREQLRLTHADVAPAIGVTARTVKAWEYAERTPNPAQIEAWAAAVGATIDLIVDVTTVRPDVDDVLVERACAGRAEWADLNRLERRAAWNKLTGRGWAPTRIGLFFDLSGSTVQALTAGLTPAPRRRRAA